MRPSRRTFLQSTAVLASAAALLQATRAFAKSLNLPLGLQLYSVRDLLPKDFAGTLKQLDALGFREVESAGYYNHSAAEVKQAVSDANLKLVSAHYASDALHQGFDQILEFSHELGIKYIICSYPGFKNPERLKSLSPAERDHAFTLEDWRWNADQFNKFGEKVHAAGMQFGYHNHKLEFRKENGISPYDELMRLTDPAKVTMEMDCGWVVVGGGDPIALLRKYPSRISMLHVKDFTFPANYVPLKDEPTVKGTGPRINRLCADFCSCGRERQHQARFR